MPRSSAMAMPADNEVVIKLDLKETSEADLSKGKNQIINALETNPVPGKENINNSDRIGFSAVRDALLAADPLHAEPAEYERQARRVLDFRDKEHGGVIKILDDLEGRGSGRRSGRAEAGFLHQ